MELTAEQRKFLIYVSGYEGRWAAIAPGREERIAFRLRDKGLVDVNDGGYRARITPSGINHIELLKKRGQA